jgi:hypothetical protein
VPRNAAQNEQVREHVDHIDGLQLAIDANGQAFMGELVDDVEHPVFPPVMGSIVDEVVGPDVVLVLRPQAEAGAIRQPQTAPFGLLVGDFQPRTPPDPLHPLVVDEPARVPQQSCNLAIAVTAILACQCDDVGSQPLSSSRPFGTLRCVERY